MAGRYQSENEGIVQRASRNNCWIRYYGKRWLTPGEFYEKYRAGSGLHKDKLEILNPLPFLHAGRKQIEEMIIAKAPASTILNALERLHKFEDKLRQERYIPLPNQKDRIPWPDERRAPVPIGVKSGTIVMKVNDCGDTFYEEP